MNRTFVLFVVGSESVAGMAFSFGCWRGLASALQGNGARSGFGCRGGCVTGKQRFEGGTRPIVGFRVSQEAAAVVRNQKDAYHFERELLGIRRSAQVAGFYGERDGTRDDRNSPA